MRTGPTVVLRRPFWVSGGLCSASKGWAHLMSGQMGTPVPVPVLPTLTPAAPFQAALEARLPLVSRREEQKRWVTERRWSRLPWPFLLHYDNKSLSASPVAHTGKKDPALPSLGSGSSEPHLVLLEHFLRFGLVTLQVSNLPLKPSGSALQLLDASPQLLVLFLQSLSAHLSPDLGLLCGAAPTGQDLDVLLQTRNRWAWEPGSRHSCQLRGWLAFIKTHYVPGTVLSQGSAHDSLLLKIKCYWNTAMPIQGHTVHSHFRATKAVSGLVAKA